MPIEFEHPLWKKLSQKGEGEATAAWIISKIIVWLNFCAQKPDGYELLRCGGLECGVCLE
jgi:hypothetical protein